MKAVRISAEESESVRKKLLSGSALDKTRKFVKKNGFIEIPLRNLLNQMNLFWSSRTNLNIIYRKKHSPAALIFLKVRKNYYRGDGRYLGK